MADQKTDKKWYLPDDTSLQPAGPLTTDEIAEKIKTGALKPDDFIWTEGLRLEKWHRVFEIAEFKNLLSANPICKLPAKFSKGIASPRPKVEHLSNVEGEYGIENIYRRYPRAPVKAAVIAHNHERFVFGEAIDVSEKGVSIKLSNESDREVIRLARGSELMVTVRHADVIPTFTAQAVVLRTITMDDNEVFG